MVIGGAYGRVSLTEDDEPARTLAARFRERFLTEFGHTRCAPLREMGQAPDGPGSCAELVERTALILFEAMDQTALKR